MHAAFCCFGDDTVIGFGSSCKANAKLMNQWWELGSALSWILKRFPTSWCICLMISYVVCVGIKLLCITIVDIRFARLDDWHSLGAGEGGARR